LVAAVAARPNYLKLNAKHDQMFSNASNGDNLSAISMDKLVIYGTTQTHSLGAKAALVLGVRFRALEVTSEDKFALRGATLAKALEEDRKKGLHPYILSRFFVLWYFYSRCLAAVWRQVTELLVTPHYSGHCGHNFLWSCR
jgi:glutamate/tyrosine decarboxylase-like PLP-dependent enzyme